MAVIRAFGAVFEEGDEACAPAAAFGLVGDYLFGGCGVAGEEECWR